MEKAESEQEVMDMIYDNKDTYDKILDISEDDIMHGALLTKSMRK